MIWWTLVLWALGKLLDWLLSKQYGGQTLSAAEKEHVEKIIYQSNRVCGVAGALGCSPEGRAP